jgi:hypothetical protein
MLEAFEPLLQVLFVLDELVKVTAPGLQKVVALPAIIVGVFGTEIIVVAVAIEVADPQEFETVTE